ncbi:Protein prenyltransferase alpha subunit repeat-containing protein 1 [Mortierella sp. AD031]|nr:Protein prenyltransferase alpha subunit repeat-containing protein 1 [Mortierella sp. AD031]
MAVNARKRLVQEGFLSAPDEIQFLNTVLTFPRNCKSSGAWHHRKWLLCFMFKNHKTEPLDPFTVEEHLEICQQAAGRYPKCYYAWTMRHWLVEHLGVHWWRASLGAASGAGVTTTAGVAALGGKDTDHDEDYYYLPLEREFERMKSHMQRNVSDHSGQQHLQQCMVQLSGQWIVQRKVQTSLSNSEVALQWTREELASRRQRRRTAARVRGRRKDNQEDMQGATGSGLQGSAIRSQVQDLSFFSVAPFSSDGGDVVRRASFLWVIRLWVLELERTRDMVRTYPGHESLWYHLRFVYYGVCWLDSEYELLHSGGDGGDGGDEEDRDVDGEQQEVEVKDGEGGEWFVSLVSERAFVEGLLTGIGESGQGGEGEVLEATTPESVQRALADKYLAWVERLDIGLQQQH